MTPDEPTAAIPGQPTGASTLLEALDQLRGQGFDRDMYITPEATVRCSTCHQDTPPSDLDLLELVRIEGVSDPADQAAVLALACRVCGARGTAVVRYGAEAEQQESIVLRAVEDHRH